MNRTCFIQLSTPDRGPEPIRIPGRIDWERMVTLARYHGTLSILHDKINRLRTIEIPERTRSTLNEYFDRCIIKKLALDHELEFLLPRFRDYDIPVIVLKGPSLSRYYPKEELREYNDLDMCIRKNDLDRAEKCLLENGYVYLEPHLLEHQKQHMGEIGFIRKDPPYITTEIHWDLINSPSLQRSTHLDLQDFWDHRTVVKTAGSEFDTYSSEYQLLFLSIHMAYQHQYDRLIWLIDSLMLVEQEGHAYDWDLIVRKSEQYGIEIAVYYIFHLMEQLFGKPIPSRIEKHLIPKKWKHRLYPHLFSGRHLISGPSWIRKLRQKLIREGLKARREK